MKKRCLLLASALFLSLSLAACGAATGGGDGAPQAPMTTPMPMPSTAPSAPAEAPEYGGMTNGRGEMTSSSTVTPIAKESKLILRANLDIQSTEFDKAVAALDQLVTDCGGYYERNEIQQGEFYDTRAARYGSFTVRLPQEQFEAFLNAAGDVGHVVSSSKSSEDVGEAYFDTEARLKTQRTKHERLLALLEKADNMENIIALETALSDVEYQIEQLSGALRKYDSLIGYSTIEVSLNEVLKITEQPKDTVSFSGRLSNAFSGGLENLGRSASNLAVWAAYHFIGLLIFLAIAAIAVVVVVKQHRKRHPKITSLPPETPQKPEE